MKNSKLSLVKFLLITVLALSYQSSLANDDSAQSLIDNAKLAALRGEYITARDYLRQVPKNSNYIQQAFLEDIRIDYYSGNTNLAFTRINTVLSKDPLNVAARTNKAEFLREEGSYDEAENEIAKIKKIAPTHLASSNELGAIKIARGDYAQAIQIFTKVLALNHSNEFALLKRSQCYREIGKAESAIQDLKQIIDKKPSNTRLRIELADSLIKLNRTNDAFEQLKIAYKLHPASMEVVEKLADLYVKTGNSTEAISLYEKVLEKMPAYASASLSLAEVYSKINEDAKAEDLLVAATAAHPTNNPVAQALVAVYQKTNQLSKLGGFLKVFIANNPNPTSAWASMNYAQLLMSVEEYKQAREVLISLNKRSKPTVDSELALAYSMAQMKDWGDVYSMLSKSNFSDPRINFNMALAAEETGKSELALENYKKITPNSKLFARAKVNSSLVLEKQGKFSEAAEELSQAKAYESELNMDVDTKLALLKSKVTGRSIASESKEDTNEKPNTETDKKD